MKRLSALFSSADLLIRSLSLLLLLVSCILLVLLTFLIQHREDVKRAYEVTFDLRIHVVFLYNNYHTQNMDRWFVHIVEAAYRNPRLKVLEVWGIGWEG